MLSTVVQVFFAGLVLSFIACFILLLIAPLFAVFSLEHGIQYQKYILLGLLKPVAGAACVV